MIEIGPPPEPHWTDKMVEAYLMEAADVMKTLPPVKVQGYFSVWPTVLHDFWDAYGWNETAQQKRWRPTPKQIDQMEYVCQWLRWPTVLESKIIWDRSCEIPWKVIEHKRQASRSTLWRHYGSGINKIVAKLNAHDPEGVVIQSYSPY